MLEHVLGQKYGEIFPRHVLGDSVQDRKPRFLSSPEQNNHPDLEGRADLAIIQTKIVGKGVSEKLYKNPTSGSKSWN